MIKRAYKYRIYPAEEQIQFFEKTFGCIRFYWNKTLEIKLKVFEENKGKSKEERKPIPQILPSELKKDYPFLKEVDSLALANTQLNLEKAFDRFFKGKAERPKFKRKKSRQSYTTNNVNNSIRVDFEKGTVRIPKIGEIRAKLRKPRQKALLFKGEMNVVFFIEKIIKYRILIYNEVCDMTKAEKIKHKIQQTKEKRRNQVPTIIQCKLQNLSNRKINLLERLFLESKWLYNWLIADINRVNLSTKDIKQVEIKVKDKLEERTLEVIGSQIKQGLQDRIKLSLKSLKQSKNSGNKVGKLKFKTKLNSIPLKQYNITYKIDRKHNKVKIQGLGSFRVLGLHQITDDMEIANASLIKKPDGYYLYITCYKQKEIITEIDKPVAIDFGIENKVNLSNGIKIDFEITETKRLKRLQQKLSKKVKGSKNYQKVKHLLQREHQKIQNIRKEIQNKLIAIAKRYSHIIFQDDNIKSWHTGWFGSEVQYSGIGGIMMRLKNNLTTPVSAIHRYQTTSKVCFNCGSKLNISLSDRQIICPVCGYSEDRDINAARNMLKQVFGNVEDSWFIQTEEEIKLIERMTENIRKYIKLSGIDSKLCPTAGLVGS